MCYGICRYEDRDGECRAKTTNGNYPNDATCVLQDLIADGVLISDDLGNYWEKKCPECEKDSMFVVRPGKVGCNNPECEECE